MGHRMPPALADALCVPACIPAWRQQQTLQLLTPVSADLYAAHGNLHSRHIVSDDACLPARHSIHCLTQAGHP